MLRRLEPQRVVALISSLHASRVSTSAAVCSQTSSFGFEDVPEDEKAGRVGKVFGGVANSYDLMNDLMSGGMHRLWKNRFVAKLQAFPGMQHLDVAGGTGDVAVRVRQAIDTACRVAARHRDDPVLQDHGCVTVCDVNQAMLREGKRKNGSQALEWVQGDAERLPFPTGSMDSYSIAFGIRNVTRIPRALQEAHRVLKPGGHFLCLEFSHIALPGLRQLYDIYSFNVIPQIGRVVVGDEASYRYLVESIRRFPQQEDFADMIRRAGLQQVEYENLTGGIVAIHSGFRALS